MGAMIESCPHIPKSKMEMTNARMKKSQ